MASQASLREYYANQFHEQGFVSVPFSIHGADIDPLFTTFREVLDEAYTPGQHGIDLIEAFKVETPGRPLDSRGFIEQRRIGQVSLNEIGRAPGTDNKDLMHYTPQTRLKVFDYMASRGGTSKAVKSLIDQCTDIHEATITAVRPAFAALGLEDVLIAPEGSPYENVHLVRILRYLGSASLAPPFIAKGDLAELHLDRSKMTAALWESRPGLVGATSNNLVGNRLITVEEFQQDAARALANRIDHHSGWAKLFAGAGYNHLPEEIQEQSGNLDPLLHGVLDLISGEERDAIVCFINQHTGFNDLVTASSRETGYTDIMDDIVNRDLRHGGLIAIDQ